MIMGSTSSIRQAQDTLNPYYCTITSLHFTFNRYNHHYDRNKKHIYLNGKYLQDAKALLDKQDYVQASEKLWGAVAQIIKAIALNRGKD